MHLQEFLRDGTLDELKEQFAIKATRHGAYPNLVSLKYHQIDSPMHLQIVQEARGVILDEAEDWAVVARPFDKFFNHGEPLAAAIDWSTARVQEKLDGSLITMYWYAGAWRVATSGTPDASGSVNGADITFEHLFWDVFNGIGLVPPGEDWRDHAFMFELTCPENKVVVRQQDRRVTLIGVRARSGHERFVNCGAWDEQYPIVRQFSIQQYSFDALIDSFSAMSPAEQEGYVVVDGSFARVKVKHPGYVALHAMAGGFGTRRAIELLQTDTATEVLSYFPEYHDIIEPVRIGMARIEGEIMADYERLRGIAVQKDFALEAVKTKCPAALFCLRSGKAPDARTFLRSITVERVEGLLGHRIEARV